jgi:hypothetical protein
MSEKDDESLDNLTRDPREFQLLERLFHLRKALLRPKLDREVQTEVSFVQLLLEAGVSDVAIAVMSKSATQ